MNEKTITILAHIPKKIDFNIVEDGNNRILVRCPICRLPYKADGIIKHIVNIGREGDQKHKQWLKDNGWE